MLRITHTQADNGRQRWMLCGRLSGPSVALLRGCWEHDRQECLVDLSDVTFIDDSGEKLLGEMKSGGAEFVAGGVATKYLLENLRTRGERLA